MVIQEKQLGFLFVVVGPGGAGKNTLMKYVLDNLGNISQLATATTRPKRDGEVDGVERHFVSLDEFQRMIAEKELLEFQEVTPNRFYGIPRASVENVINRGEDLIADIDVKGAETLKSTYGKHIITVFVTVPGNTLEERLRILEQRMQERNEDSQVIQERITRARDVEFPFAEKSDYVIVNDDLARASKELLNIVAQIRAERDA